jgi:hypothetical protein
MPYNQSTHRVLLTKLLFCGTGVSTQGFMLAKQVVQTASPFCPGYFGDGVSQTICLGWPQTSILPISASQVARITGRSLHTQLDQTLGPEATLCL